MKKVTFDILTYLSKIAKNINIKKRKPKSYNKEQVKNLNQIINEKS